MWAVLGLGLSVSDDNHSLCIETEVVNVLASFVHEHVIAVDCEDAEYIWHFVTERS